MTRGKGKIKTKVVNIIENKEYIFESRLSASKFIGMERKRINCYIDKGLTFKKTFKIFDMRVVK